MQPFFYTISRECRVTALEEPCSSGRCPISALLLPASSLNRRDKSIEEIRGRSANHFELCFGLHLNNVVLYIRTSRAPQPLLVFYEKQVSKKKSNKNYRLNQLS